LENKLVLRELVQLGKLPTKFIRLTPDGEIFHRKIEPVRPEPVFGA
jgi:hypothetical protein